MKQLIREGNGARRPTEAFTFQLRSEDEVVVRAGNVFLYASEDSGGNLVGNSGRGQRRERSQPPYRE